MRLRSSLSMICVVSAVFILGSLAFTATVARAVSGPEDLEGPLKGKNICILVANEFEDIEAYYPFIRLSEEGAWIVFGCLRIGSHPRPVAGQKPITGRFGSTIPPYVFQEGRRFSMEEVGDLDPDKFDALVIPGGFAPDRFRIDRATVDFTKAIHRQGKPIAAICHGPSLLISAGILKGKKATCYRAITDDLVNAGATFLDQPVVVDGNIITSRTPDDLPEFCREIIKALK